MRKYGIYQVPNHVIAQSYSSGDKPTSRTSSRLSLMSRNESEASLDMSLFQTEDEEEDENISVDIYKPR